MKLNQTSNYITKSGCVLKLSSSSSIILHEIPLLFHDRFTRLFLPLFLFHLSFIYIQVLSPLYIYISTIFHDQPPVDDYANYRRNVLVTARNQRKGWLKQRGWTRRYFSPLFLSLSLDHHPLALRPLSGWRGRKRPGRESNTSLSLVEERERKRERDEIISPLTGIIPPTWINGEKKGDVTNFSRLLANERGFVLHEYWNPGSCVHAAR